MTLDVVLDNIIRDPMDELETTMAIEICDNNTRFDIKNKDYVIYNLDITNLYEVFMVNFKFETKDTNIKLRVFKVVFEVILLTIFDCETCDITFHEEAAYNMIEKELDELDIVFEEKFDFMKNNYENIINYMNLIINNLQDVLLEITIPVGWSLVMEYQYREQVFIKLLRKKDIKYGDF